MQVTRASIVLQMLRSTAQHRSRTNTTPCAYDGPTFNNHMGRHGGLFPNGNLFTDDGKRAYIDSISQFCRGMHDGSWVDIERHRLCPSRGLSAKNTCNSASAASTLSTNARPRTRQTGP